MTDVAVTWSAVGSVIGVFVLVSGTLWTIWWRIEGKVKEAKESAYHKSDEARLKAEAAHGQAYLVREELHAYKTHVAEHYVSKQGHRESTDQIMSALSGVKTAIDGTNQRIDRLFDDRPKGGSPPN